MVNGGEEMERRGFTIRAIGGATASAHAAVKIEQNYSDPTVYVQEILRVHGRGGGATLRQPAR